MYLLLNLTADKYKDSTPDAKNTDNTAKNAEPLINLDGKCATALDMMAASYADVFCGLHEVLGILSCYSTVIQVFKAMFKALGMQGLYTSF